MQELEILLIGQPNIDVDNWRAHTEYRGDYSDSHEVIGWFWEIIEDYSEEDRAKLLQFTTGTSRVPAQVRTRDHYSPPSLLPPAFHCLSVRASVPAPCPTDTDLSI